MNRKLDFANVNKPKDATLPEQYANLANDRAKVCGATILYAGIELPPIDLETIGMGESFRALQATARAMGHAQQCLEREWESKKGVTYVKSQRVAAYVPQPLKVAK